LNTSPTIFLPLTFLIRVLTPSGSKCRNWTGQADGADGGPALCARAGGLNTKERITNPEAMLN
jgi:hypothetical protein